MDSEQRPPIPEPMKREIRQRCGFGCVICGLPIYQYEHILGWANVKRHVAGEITLLCPNHHEEKRKNLLTEKQISVADANPYNIKNNSSSPYKLNYFGNHFEIILGITVFSLNDIQDGSTLIPLMVYDKQLLAMNFIGGQLLVNFSLFNSKDELILEIQNNELVYSITCFDYEFIGNNLTIREKLGDILLDVEFDIAQSKLIINKGTFSYKGNLVEVNKHKIIGKAKTGSAIHFNGNAIRGNKNLIGYYFGNSGDKLPYPCMFFLA